MFYKSSLKVYLYFTRNFICNGSRILRPTGTYGHTLGCIKSCNCQGESFHAEFTPFVVCRRSCLCCCRQSDLVFTENSEPDNSMPFQERILRVVGVYSSVILVRPGSALCSNMQRVAKHLLWTAPQCAYIHTHGIIRFCDCVYFYKIRKPLLKLQLHT